ncbi:MAG: hypothetical protein VB084_05175 [Syntrophomonadaceae bacterium]|nr:hypothetical protein [Syntrophomonadaceae bacterium]
MSFQRERTPIERFYYTLALIVGILFLFSLIGNSIDITLKVPANGVVYGDFQNNIYYAPPYIDNNRYPSTLDVKSLKAETVAEAQQRNHKPDPVCVEQDYFKEYNSLTNIIGVRLGLAKPKPSRWNPDGSWNW